MARFLTAQWRHLVMLNYEAEPTILRPLTPRGVELDSWNGRYFVSVVGFMFKDTKVMGVPIPFHRSFEEVNLRFYVARNEEGERRRGVVFVREVVPRPAISFIARRSYNEPYLCCPMGHEVKIGPDEVGRVSYRWRSPTGWLEIAAEFSGAPKVLQTGSEAEFITEHYWGYTPQRDGSTLEYRVDHPSWRVWSAESHAFTGDPAAFYGERYRQIFARPAASVFIAEGSPVTVYRGRRLPD